VEIVRTQHFKTVVLLLGLGKRWPLCTTVDQLNLAH